MKYINVVLILPWYLYFDYITWLYLTSPSYSKQETYGGVRCDELFRPAFMLLFYETGAYFQKKIHICEKTNYERQADMEQTNASNN